MASQTKTQWPEYMKEVYRILKQDGWIQCAEFRPFYKCDDGTVPEGAALWKVNFSAESTDCSFKSILELYLKTKKVFFCMVSI
jgi:ubiquinone/menaquinone biosynthesis C-methylase UbiE